MDFLSLKPIYHLNVNGQSVMSVFSPRLISMTHTDNRGFEADTLNISLDDHDGAIALPPTGATISVQFGMGVLIDKGDFIVDGIAHTGAPDIVTISAKSADFKKKFIEQKNYSFVDKTINEIVEKIAKDHDLKFKVSDELAKIRLKNVQQDNESDANLLTRIAEEHDAIASIKKGTLLFIKRGDGKTASGQELPVIIIKRKDGDQHAYSLNDRDAYTGVKAKYTTAKDGKRKEVLAGDEERTKMLRKTFQSEEEAMNAAENELKKLKRAVASFSFSLAIGNATLLSESPMKTVGFKKDIDEKDWIAKTVMNSISNNGFTTRVDAEIKEPKEE